MIIAGAAPQVVLAGTAIEGVVARTPVEQVGIPEARQGVIAAGADDDVAVRGADQSGEQVEREREIAEDFDSLDGVSGPGEMVDDPKRTAIVQRQEEVVAIPGKVGRRFVEGRANGVRAARIGDRVRAVGSVEDVYVVSRTTLEDVAAAAAIEGVGAAGAGQGVLTGSADNGLYADQGVGADLRPDCGAGAQVDRDPGGGAGVAHLVDSEAAGIGVVAGARPADDQVVAGRAVDRVVPVAGNQSVCTGAAVEEVVAAQALHRIVAGTGEDDVISGGTVERIAAVVAFEGDD